jgi:hypothetical protein
MPFRLSRPTCWPWTGASPSQVLSAEHVDANPVLRLAEQGLPALFVRESVQRSAPVEDQRARGAVEGFALLRPPTEAPATVPPLQLSIDSPLLGPVDRPGQSIGEALYARLLLLGRTGVMQGTRG